MKALTLDSAGAKKLRQRLSIRRGIVGLGLILEIPIFVFFLALMRVVTARWMWRNLRYSILAIFVLAATVTPTTGILNMCLFAAPMVGLYGISIGVAWLVDPGHGRRGSALQSPAQQFP